MLGVASRRYEDTNSKDKSIQIIEAFAESKLISYFCLKCSFYISRKDIVYDISSMVNQLISIAIILTTGKNEIIIICRQYALENTMTSETSCELQVPN